MNRSAMIIALAVLLAGCSSEKAADTKTGDIPSAGSEDLAGGTGENDLAGAPVSEEPVTDFTELCRPDATPAGVLSIGPLEFQGDQVDAFIEDSDFGPILQLRLQSEAAQSLAELTEATLGQPLPLSVDGRVLMSPVVQEVIRDGALSVSGRFSRAELEQIAIRFADACGDDGTRNARD